LNRGLEIASCEAELIPEQETGQIQSPNQKIESFNAYHVETIPINSTSVTFQKVYMGRHTALEGQVMGFFPRQGDDKRAILCRDGLWVIPFHVVGSLEMIAMINYTIS
jgi:hypothetical protein